MVDCVRLGRRWIAIVLVLVACGASTPSIEGFSPTLTEVAPAQADWVAGDWDAAVAAARWLVAVPADVTPELPTRVAVIEAQTAAGDAVLRLVASGEPPPAYRDRFGPTLEVVVEVESSRGPIDPDQHGAMAVDRAVAVLDAKVGLTLDGEDAVPSLLAADDGQIVLVALDWIAAHRARQFADDVAALVERDDPWVALRAIECLGLVGGPEHVDALVRKPRLADPAWTRRLYETVAVLGGDHARGFLEFAARNEDDPDLAKAAERALSQLGMPAPSTAAKSPQTRGHR